jgi:phospholipid/cholesterol/gamma-HCH transport system substrate-binding protein
MQKNIVETLVGVAVITVAVGFGYYAYKASDMSRDGGYEVLARFESVDGLSIGSDVRISGIKVGVVSNQTLNPEDYRAAITLHLKDGVKVPADSTAAVVGDGLLGSKFVSIVPGGDETMLPSGGEITITQSSVSLESLIGKFMFSGGGVDQKDAKEPEGTL